MVAQDSETDYHTRKTRLALRNKTIYLGNVHAQQFEN